MPRVMKSGRVASKLQKASEARQCVAELDSSHTVKMMPKSQLCHQDQFGPRER